MGKDMDFPTTPPNQNGVPKILPGASLSDPPAKDPPADTTLGKLLTSYKAIQAAAEKDVVFTQPWVSFGEASIITKGTINLIQGKAGVHKSRLAETLCALLLCANSHEVDFLGFVKQRFAQGFCVAYIDTERNTQEHLPAAVQRIRERAGLDKKSDCPRFYPVSIKNIDRKERLEAVKTWITHVRGDMKERGIDDWNLFVVLDVVSDCVASFNNDEQSLALFDYLGRLCEDQHVSFLLVLHENPGSEKARGHVGTEGMNKADTQLQIGYDTPDNSAEGDLIKVRFLKTRNSARPAPLYLEYSTEAKGLILADAERVGKHIDSKRKAKDESLLVDALMQVFDTVEDVTQTELISLLNVNGIDWSKNTIVGKLKAFCDGGTAIKNKKGQDCHLTKTESRGKPSVYTLTPIQPQNENTAN